MLVFQGEVDLDRLERQGNDMRRLKSVKITPELLPDLFKPGKLSIESSIPNDAEGVMLALSDDKRTILVILRSQEFDPVPIGEMPPEIDASSIIFTRLLLPDYEP